MYLCSQKSYYSHMMTLTNFRRHNMLSRTLNAVVFVLIAFLVSCGEFIKEPTEADMSAFGKNVYDIDSARLEKNYARILDADTSRVYGDDVVRKRYKAASDVGEASLWATRMGVSSDADKLLALLREELPLNGLDSTAFFLPEIAGDLNVVHLQAFDSLGVDINELLPRLDYNLSKAYVRYTAGQRYGFMNPVHPLNHLDFKSGGRGYARLFDYEVPNPDYEASLHSLCSDERMEYLSASKPKGTFYPALRRRMENTTDTAERRTIAINMERCRWQMRQPESAHRSVLVNIPAQQLWAVAPDTVLNMRICCGALHTKTPLLSSDINIMQVNPDWMIPQSIIKGEVSRHGGDSAYFARRRYYIVNRSTGASVQASSVSASQLASGNYSIGQRGGAGNSLGRIVFRFPNDFAVYLHDTSNRSAFSRDVRTLSHGCVRVEKPLELALFLLPGIDSWTADRIRISMDIPPATDQGRQYLKEHSGDRRPFRLINTQKVTPNVPVHIIYFTAFPNPATKQVELWPDIYGFDKIIARHIQDVMIK